MIDSRRSTLLLCVLETGVSSASHARWPPSHIICLTCSTSMHVPLAGITHEGQTVRGVMFTFASHGDIADSAALACQALRSDGPLRGDVRPLLPVGGQLHRAGQPPLLHHLPVAGAGGDRGGGRGCSSAAPLERPRAGRRQRGSDLDSGFPGCRHLPGCKRWRSCSHTGNLHYPSFYMLHMIAFLFVLS